MRISLSSVFLFVIAVAVTGATVYVRVKREMKFCNKLSIEFSEENITSATKPIFTKLKLWH